MIMQSCLMMLSNNSLQAKYALTAAANKPYWVNMYLNTYLLSRNALDLSDRKAILLQFSFFFLLSHLMLIKSTESLR